MLEVILEQSVNTSSMVNAVDDISELLKPFPALYSTLRPVKWQKENPPTV